MKLNQEIKGGNVTIFALELVDQIKAHQVEVKEKNVERLLKYVKTSDPAIDKLLQNFIGNVFMVKDMDTAFELSAKYP